MKSWLVSCWNRVIFNHCSKRNYWAFEWFSKSSFTRSFPVCQEVLNISQMAIGFHRISHHFSSNPHCCNSAEVPSFTLRTALSTMPCVSDRWSVAVRCFHDRSSQDLPNSNELSEKVTCGLCDGSRNFLKLFSVSWEVFVLHGYDWIHWVARSCTTTANRWLFRDSPSSLRTMWSTVIKSPNFSARRRASPVCLLQGALVIGCHFCRTCRIWVMRNVVIQIICDLLQPLRKISQTAVRLSIVTPLFVLVLGFLGCDPLQFPGTNSSLRSWAGRVEDKSCSVDVEDALLPELADKPGTLRAVALSRRDQDREPILVLRLLALLHWPLPPQWWFLDLRKVSSSPELKPSFAQHVHWCSWIGHELSLFWRFWSGRQHCPGFNRSIKRSFVRILELVNSFSPSHSHSAGASFLGARFPLVTCPRT